MAKMKTINGSDYTRGHTGQYQYRHDPIATPMMRITVFGANPCCERGNASYNEGPSNYGRINVMGALDTSDADSAIANHGHFFVQYIEGVADIAGKENISGSAMMFLVFDEDGLTKALERNYTDIIVADEILLSKNLTIPSGTNLLILEECGLEVPLNVV